jgi:acetyl esterase/lipase
VFVHGGYWKAFDKSVWSHLASGPLAHGYAVAMPSYTLCPDNSISGIAREIAAAIGAAAKEVSGPIRLTGHSAGGQLVTRMISGSPLLPPEVLGRIAGVTSISGVHDLRPVMRTEMNDILKIDAAEAQTESPVLLAPLAPIPVMAWVGADERPEFVRQNRALLRDVARIRDPASDVRRSWQAPFRRDRRALRSRASALSRISRAGGLKAWRIGEGAELSLCSRRHPNFVARA